MSASLVQVQTLRGSQGLEEAIKTVQAAVDAHNKANPKAPAHVVETVMALPNNTKGMQWQLALLATLARKNGATMIRLNVHNAQVALCGPAKAIEATKLEMVPHFNHLSTLAAATYNPAKDGNKVGFMNGFLCGCPAGLQDSWKITTTLQYGVGFLFAFPAPGTGVAYEIGYKAAGLLHKPEAQPKPRAAKKPKAVEAPVVPAIEAESVEATEAA